jgi:hypothetical protein
VGADALVESDELFCLGTGQAALAAGEVCQPVPLRLVHRYERLDVHSRISSPVWLLALAD